MGNWNTVSKEVASIPPQTEPSQPSPYDVVRKRKLARLAEITSRNVVLYAVDFPPSNPIRGQFVDTSISLVDKAGFDEVTRNLSGPALDVVLHTPGGSAEATESIVALLRSRFDDVRFIVPNFAKSAGTMMAMAGNVIILDERSELGPTDPQMRLVRGQQQFVSPAHAIKDQFEKAQDEINGNPSRLPGWVPILQQIGPSLLTECDHHIQLSRVLVEEWLEKYMFAGEVDGPAKAARIAEHLANHQNFLSHGRRIGIDELKDLGVKLLDMRTDEPLREAVWDLHLATSLTFMNTNAYKMFENHQSDGLFYQAQIQAVPAGAADVPAPAAPKAPKPNKNRPPRGQRDPKLTNR